MSSVTTVKVSNEHMQIIKYLGFAVIAVIFVVIFLSLFKANEGFDGKGKGGVTQEGKIVQYNPYGKGNDDLNNGGIYIGPDGDYGQAGEGYGNGDDMGNSGCGNGVDKNGAFVDPSVGGFIEQVGFEDGGYDDALKYKMRSNIPSNEYLLDDGANEELTIVNNMCSKSCCSPQWPTPFTQDTNEFVIANRDKFVPSSYFCNDSYNSAGCICLTKTQNQFLLNRGNNGGQWY